MHCLACNVLLTPEEQKRKFKDTTNIKNPEDMYLGLCNSCLGVGTDEDLSADFGIVPEE